MRAAKQVIHREGRRIPEVPLNAALRCLVAGLLLAVYGLSVGCGTTTHVIPKEDWISALEPLTAATIRLNNYSSTPVPGQPPVSAFHVANDATFELPSPPLSRRFDIPIARQEPYSFYINDLRSTDITVDAIGGRALIRTSFEDEGQELIGNCVDNLICVCGDPRIDFDEARLDLAFRLRMQDARIVLWQPAARFTSTFGETGPCHNNLCAFACDLFAPDRENQARAAIERQATALITLQRPVVEDLVNTRVRSIVGPAAQINSVLIGGTGDLVVVTRD